MTIFGNDISGWVGEEAKPESMMYKHLSVYSRILHDIRIFIINHCCLLIDGRIASPSQVRFEGQKATARSELPEQWQLDKKDQAKALLCVMTRSRVSKRELIGVHNAVSNSTNFGFASKGSIEIFHV
ncbi:hypothetical protein T02_12415 [Trichinella nativa]|uniref:Uncharacterized protein n=1 Tax=Trichinella nativa TaxID=6335 RepID=A0A0V1KS53_9BILA|nr:hypothetical protein T02_12415 [Trichinella nativa]